MYRYNNIVGIFYFSIINIYRDPPPRRIYAYDTMLEGTRRALCITKSNTSFMNTIVLLIMFFN